MIKVELYNLASVNGCNLKIIVKVKEDPETGPVSALCLATTGVFNIKQILPSLIPKLSFEAFDLL